MYAIRSYYAPIHHGRYALGIQHRDQCLTDTQLRDRLLGIECGVAAESFGSGPHRFLVAGRVSTQRVLV